MTSSSSCRSHRCTQHASEGLTPRFYVMRFNSIGLDGTPKARQWWSICLRSVSAFHILLEVSLCRQRITSGW